MNSSDDLLRHCEIGQATRRKATSAFTLIELLLSVAVVLMLLGAMVVSFADMQSGARMAEGVDRFETLLRLCRAQSSLTGERVRLDFIEEDGGSETPERSRLVVAQETEPLAEPGIFQVMRGPEWKLGSVNELVAIEEATVMYSNSSESRPRSREVGEDLNSIPWIMFYPDGSSDSARVVLVSRAEGEDEVGRVEMLLQGITGEVRRRDILSGDDSQEGIDQPPGP